jgi:hypothetical protein
MIPSYYRVSDALAIRLGARGVLRGLAHAAQLRVDKCCILGSKHTAPVLEELLTLVERHVCMQTDLFTDKIYGHRHRAGGVDDRFQRLHLDPGRDAGHDELAAQRRVGGQGEKHPVITPYITKVIAKIYPYTTHIYTRMISATFIHTPVMAVTRRTVCSTAASRKA